MKNKSGHTNHISITSCTAGFDSQQFGHRLNRPVASKLFITHLTQAKTPMYTTHLTSRVNREICISTDPVISHLND